MAQQERESARDSARSDTGPVEDVQAAPSKAAPSASQGSLDADVDAILDEIDGVLEENAEDFVKSFVQKGGE